MNTLVIMADSRALLHQNKLKGYLPYVAYINSMYCNKHSYDFCLYSPSFSESDNDQINKLNSTNLFRLLKLVIRKFRKKTIFDTENKLKVSCFNKKLKQKRASPWFKLIALEKTLELNYQTIVYIDSDCAFIDFNLSLEKYLKKTKAVSPVKNQVPCAYFLNDFPYYPNLPCSAFIVLKKNELTKTFINSWWNYDIPKHNFTHKFEQSALYKILPEFKNDICILDDVYMEDRPGQYLRHMSCNENEKRESYFKKMAQKIEQSSDQKIVDVLKGIKVKKTSMLL